MQYSCEAEISDFDLSSISIDKNIVTLKIPVNHRRILRMQIVQAFENLPCPVLDGLGIDFPMLHTISSHGKKACQEMGKKQGKSSAERLTA